MSSALLEKLKKNSRIASTDTLSDSVFFKDNEVVSTPVPVINIALSGGIYGGLMSGLKVFAGPSKHFKTSFALLMASSYMNAHPDAIMLFYDSEFGSPQTYFKAFGIDTSRVIHSPILNIEELKNDLVHQLDNLDRNKDNVIIVVDSIGNVASLKELEDAKNNKTVNDMTRAKALKGLFRMIVPYLKMKKVPMIAINHTYKEQGMYPKDIVSGGTGSYYGADDIWIIGRQQDKDGTEINGYDFIINIEKSRFVKEKSKIPVHVTWKGGISKWGGLTDIAQELGYVRSPKKGWYQAFDPETNTEYSKNVRWNDTLKGSFWKPLFDNTKLNEKILEKFKIPDTVMVSENEIADNSNENEDQEDEA